MGVLDFDDDDLEPFPRKVLRNQAHAAGSIKDAKVKISSMALRGNQISQQRRREIFNTEDTLQMDGLAHEASKCNLSSFISPVESEVIVGGEDLIFARGILQVPEVELQFMTDSIALKFFDDCGILTNINLPLNEIIEFCFRSCQQTRNDILELTLTKIGAKHLQHKVEASLEKPVVSSDEDFTLATRIKKLNGLGLARRITSLCDRYKVLWRPWHFNNNDKIGSDPFDWRGCRNTEIDRTTWSDLIYPRGDSDAVTVTMDDFLLLNPCEFVSDTIIDFYIKYLQSRIPEHEKKRVYFFNSFFFRKLTKIETDLEQTGSTFEQLRRWTRDINIFEKDFLFIPIMQSAHWSLVIVCYPGKLFKHEHQSADGYKECSIVHFDSMEGFHKGVQKPIEKYLIEQWSYTFSMPIPKEDRTLCVKCVRAKVPQQTNFSDCGLFMLHYVEIFLKALESLSPKIQVSRDWFNPEDLVSKRSMIQRLIRKMQEEELQGKAAIKHVDLLPEELTNGTMPMQDAPVVLKVDESQNKICETEAESTGKADSPRFASIADSCACQKKAVSLLDCSFQQAPALSSSGYCRVRPASHVQPDAGNQIASKNNVANMEITHPVHICAHSDGRDVIEICKGLISSETTNNVHKKRCSVSSTSNALKPRTTRLGKVHASDIKSESNFLTISEDSAKELSNSACLEFAHPMHLLVLSNKRHAILTSEDLVSRETNNRKHEKRHSVSPVSNPLQSKPIGMSNMCVSICATGSDSNMEGLVFDGSDNATIPASRSSCLPCTGHETPSRVDDDRASLDTNLDNSLISSRVSDEATCSKSGEESVGINPEAHGPTVQLQQVSGSLDPLYISSDEETGFVKVQKLVEASKIQRIARLQNRQRNASSLKSASTRNATEGIENQPSNMRWRLRRKSQMLLS